MSPRRTVLLGGLLLLLAAAPFVLWAVTKGGDEPVRTRSGLILERYVDPSSLKPEIVVYLPERKLNDAGTVPDRKVRLQCFDAKELRVVSTREKWPLTTDLGGALPHAHRPVSSDTLDRIRRCSLTGGKLRLTGAKFR